MQKPNRNLIKNIYLFLIALLLLVTLFLPIFFSNLLIRIFRKKDISNYILNVAIGLDQLGGSVLYNQPDWTVSSWTYIQSKKHIEHKIFMHFIDFFFGKNHCYNSYINEVNEFRNYIQNSEAN
jgi:hypothetical protein